MHGEIAEPLLQIVSELLGRGFLIFEIQCFVVGYHDGSSVFYPRLGPYVGRFVVGLADGLYGKPQPKAIDQLGGEGDASGARLEGAHAAVEVAGAFGCDQDFAVLLEVLDRLAEGGGVVHL